MLISEKLKNKNIIACLSGITIEDETREYYKDMETNAQFIREEHDLDVNKSFDIFFLTDYLDDDKVYGNFLREQ